MHLTKSELVINDRKSVLSTGSFFSSFLFSSLAPSPPPWAWERPSHKFDRPTDRPSVVVVWRRKFIRHFCCYC